MNTAKSIGRTFGALLIAQSLIGYLVNFVLLAPAVAPPGFLTNAAANAFQMNLAALLAPVEGALWIAMAIVAFPLLRQYSQSLAIAFLVLTGVSLAGLIVEAIGIRSLLALSVEYTRAGDANATLFQPLAAMVRALRNSAHYLNLLVGGGILTVVYTLLFRCGLIPRALSILGLVTVASMVTGAIIPLLGYPTIMAFFMPMGVSQLALTVWLLFKGFEERPRSSHAARLATAAG
jgi:Domain of unknown function (DUF4386)